MRKEFEASYTVEAALIYPIIIMVIFAIMALGMFMHNRVKLLADSTITGEYARVIYRNERGEVAKAMILNHAETMYAEGYISAKAALGSLALTDRGAVCIMEYILEVSSPPFMIYPNGKLTVKKQYSAMNRECITRMVSIVADILD